MPTPQDDQVHKPDQQQIDPGTLLGEQTPPKNDDKTEAELKIERDKLSAMQDRTEKQVHEVAEEALSVILAMGWCFGAIINPETKEPEFAILRLPLEMWQDVNREMLRKKLMGL